MTYAILCVNARFVHRQADKSLTTESNLLTMRRLREKHSGDYQASIVASVVMTLSKLFCMAIADSEGDNDTAAGHFSARL